MTLTRRFSQQKKWGKGPPPKKKSPPKKLFQKIIFSQFQFRPGWTAGGVRALWVSEHPLWRTGYSSFFLLLSFSFHLLFSQKGFAYDFDILHAFLSSQKKIEGRTPPSPPKLSFLGEQQACAMGNRGRPLASAIFFLVQAECVRRNVVCACEGGRSGH